MASEIPVFDSVDFRAGGPDMRPRLSRNVIALGLVSLCMAMSSAMIHGLLPAFLVTELGVNVLSVGAIEGIAEATTSFVKIFSGRLSDGLGRRKVLVVLGYVLSAGAKLLFPLAESASSILAARTTDRIGKGLWSPDGALYGWCRRRAPDGHRPHDAIRGQLPPGVLASGDPRFLVHSGAGDRSRRSFRLARRAGAQNNNAPERSPAAESCLLVGGRDSRRSRVGSLQPSVPAAQGWLDRHRSGLCPNSSRLDEPGFFSECLSLRHVGGSHQPEAAARHRGGIFDPCRSRASLCANDLADRHRSRFVGSADGPHSRSSLRARRRCVASSSTGHGIRDL